MHAHLAFEGFCLGVVLSGPQGVSQPPLAEAPVLLPASKQSGGNGLHPNLILEEEEEEKEEEEEEEEEEKEEEEEEEEEEANR